MRVVEWVRPSRVLSDHEVDIFFNRPLEAPTMFQFTTSKFETPSHTGAFSLKWVTSGEEEYLIGNRRIRLNAGQFLFVNSGEQYSSRIQKTTRSGSIFIPETDKSAALLALHSHETGNIDPAHVLPKTEIPQCSFTLPEQKSKQLGALLCSANELDKQRQSDAARILIMEALNALFAAAPVSALAQYAKRSTRDELLQRLSRAKTEIDETRGKISDLQHLSETACLSKYYFLRLFRDVYGMTPMMYARSIRLKDAVRALAAGNDPKKTARSAGYSDMRAFLRACNQSSYAASQK